MKWNFPLQQNKMIRNVSLNNHCRPVFNIEIASMRYICNNEKSKITLFFHYSNDLFFSFLFLLYFFSLCSPSECVCIVSLFYAHTMSAPWRSNIPHIKDSAKEWDKKASRTDQTKAIRAPFAVVFIIFLCFCQSDDVFRRTGKRDSIVQTL